MEAIPKHDYYRNREALKAANTKDMHRVMDDMEKTVELMDLEELERRAVRRREEEALRVIREREVLMEREEVERVATEDLRRKLSMLDSNFPRAPVGETTSSKIAKQKQQKQQQQQQQQQQQPTEEDVPPLYDDLPPPIPFSPVPPPPTGESTTTQPPPPSAPPSYNDLTPPAAAPSYDRIPLSRHRSENKLKTNNNNTSSTSYQQQAQSMRSLPVEGNTQHHVSSSSSMGDTLPVPMEETEDGGGHQQQQPPPPPKVSFTTLRTACTMEYNALLKTQTVQTFILSTYQGRINNRPNLDSTNGCAVISPLVAAQHLASPGSGISDSAIEQIIDSVAPPILNRVRNKLGLGALALIIPSDVHDFLVDEGILKQDKFVGVCGGNLLDGVHVKEFLDMMESGGGSSDNNGSSDGDDEEKKKKKKKKGTVVAPNTATSTTTNTTSKVAQKVAATLFFHEHVVSIVKVVLSNGTSWFDIVDSLPRRQNNGVMGATRTRCKDRDSLRTVLFWYASNKFSQTDVQYIDSNEWDDTMCDLDPRVFQAFAWQE